MDYSHSSVEDDDATFGEVAGRDPIVPDVYQSVSPHYSESEEDDDDDQQSQEQPEEEEEERSVTLPAEAEEARAQADIIAAAVSEDEEEEANDVVPLSAVTTNEVATVMAMPHDAPAPSTALDATARPTVEAVPPAAPSSSSAPPATTGSRPAPKATAAAVTGAGEASNREQSASTVDSHDAENARLFDLYQERLQVQSQAQRQQQNESAQGGRYYYSGAVSRSPASGGYVRRGSDQNVVDSVRRASAPSGGLGAPAPISPSRLGQQPQSGSRRRSNSLGYYSVGPGSTAAESAHQQYLRHASAISSARYQSARRASSVVRQTGLPEGGSTPRRHSFTDGEIFAMEVMRENDARRMEAAERAELTEIEREAIVVETELLKEKNNYEFRLRLEAERKRSLREKMEDRIRRSQEAAHRRAALEAERQQRTAEKLSRVYEAPRDPYALISAKRRYSTPVARTSSTPRRRDSEGVGSSAVNRPTRLTMGSGTGAPGESVVRRGSAMGVTEASRRGSAPVAASPSPMMAGTPTNGGDVGPRATRTSMIRAAQWRSSSAEHNHAWH